MPCKEVEFTVNNRKYRATEWPPTVALPMLFELLKYGAPILGVFIELSSKVGADDQIQESAIQEISSKLTSIDPHKLSEIVQRLVSGIFSESSNIKISDVDAYFNNFPEDLFPAAIHCIRIQLSRFLAGSGLASIVDLAGLRSQKT